MSFMMLNIFKAAHKQAYFKEILYNQTGRDHTMAM